MIYYFEDELKPICTFLGADYQTVLDWLEANKETKKYIEFQRISSMGQDIYQLTYGKNTNSNQKVVCHVSYLGTHFKE